MVLTEVNMKQNRATEGQVRRTPTKGRINSHCLHKDWTAVAMCAGGN